MTGDGDARGIGNRAARQTAGENGVSRVPLATSSRSALGFTASYFDSMLVWALAAAASRSFGTSAVSNSPDSPL